MGIDASATAERQGFIGIQTGYQFVVAKEVMLKLLTKIAVSAILFWFLLQKVNLADMANKLQSLDSKVIPFVFMLIALNYAVSSARWYILLHKSDKEKVSLGYLITLYFTGSFFNNFMPTSIGGDVYKVVKLGTKIQNKSQAFAATFTERFLGVVALIVISILGAIKLYGYLAAIVFVLFILAVIVGYFVLKVMSSKFPVLEKIYEAFDSYRSRQSDLGKALLLSLVIQICSVLSQYLVFVALGQQPPLIYAFTVLPVITLAGFFIPSLNGIGVQDALYVSLFAPVGVISEVALTASISYHIIRLIVSLFGGLMYAAGMDDKN
jgi:glycosyltransferase 2 family protein